MGQAFDRDGNVLGEAFGDSKREVFEKLNGLAPDAHEITIKAMKDKIEQAERQVSQRDRMMRFFTYTHLPSHLQSASKPFCDLAEFIVASLPANPERTVALRKLLEAKDCAVRALLESQV